MRQERLDLAQVALRSFASPPFTAVEIILSTKHGRERLRPAEAYTEYAPKISKSKERR